MSKAKPGRFWLRRSTPLLGLISALLFGGLRPSFAQNAAPKKAAKPEPDVILFTNGDRLTGKLLYETKGSVTFQSDSVGNVTVGWDKIKSISSHQNFAVIRQGVRINRKTPDTMAPQGTLSVEDQKIDISSSANGTTTEIPTSDAAYVVDAATYVKEVKGSPGWLSDWTGTATLGAAQIDSTQTSRSFTTAFTAARTVPNVNWMDPRLRTTLGFNSAYGSISQPNIPTVKTSILNADAEQDWYVSPRFYALADGAWQHNYSLGLDLQESYGGGFGLTVLKNARQELDAKVDIHFERQEFGITPGVIPPPPPTPSLNLIGADFGDVYSLKLAHGILFNENATISPAFNVTNAYSAVFNATLAFPVYKHFSFTVGALDNYVNDPAVGSNPNSFQYTGGLTYTFK